MPYNSGKLDDLLLDKFSPSISKTLFGPSPLAAMLYKDMAKRPKPGIIRRVRRRALNAYDYAKFAFRAIFDQENLKDE